LDDLVQTYYFGLQSLFIRAGHRIHLFSHRAVPYLILEQRRW
jgi:hypothetical protein